MAKSDKRSKRSKRSKDGGQLDLKSRSALTNANRLILGDVDGRTALSRRYRDVRDQILLDLGGMDSVPAMKYAVVEQAAALTIMAEEQVGYKLSEDQRYDHKIHMDLIKQLGPVARILGIRRVPKNVSPASEIVDLEDYVKSRGDGRRERSSDREKR